jgi:hypothetical protein
MKGLLRSGSFLSEMTFCESLSAEKIVRTLRRYAAEVLTDKKISHRFRGNPKVTCSWLREVAGPPKGFESAYFT